LWTDIREQIRFVQARFADGTITGPRVLDPAAVREMHTPLRAFTGSEVVSLGWSWIVLDFEGGRLITHDGATFGQAAVVAAAPEQRWGIAVLTNSQTGSVVTEAATSEALKQYFGIDTGGSGGGSGGGLRARNMTEAQLREYAGRYEVPTIRFTLTPRDGKLDYTYEWLGWPGAIKPSNDVSIPDGTLTFVGTDVAVGDLDNPSFQIGFERGKDDRVRWLSLGVRLYPKVV
jgi:hypothetical protein